MLFLLGHVTGNLLIFVGPEIFNTYGHKLATNPLLYVIEFGLIGIFVTHMINAGLNWNKNREARGKHRYQVQAWAEGKSRKSLSSTTMIISGVTILVFVIYHVATMKYGAGFEITHDGEGVRDLAAQLRSAFANPLVVVAYEIVIALVGMHLWHGFSSAFQTLGINRPRLAHRLQIAGWIFACVVAGGFLSIPAAIFLGLI